MKGDVLIDSSTPRYAAVVRVHEGIVSNIHEAIVCVCVESTNNIRSRLHARKPALVLYRHAIQHLCQHR